MSFLSKSSPKQTWKILKNAENREESLAMPFAKRVLINLWMYLNSHVKRCLKGQIIEFVLHAFYLHIFYILKNHMKRVNAK